MRKFIFFALSILLGFIGCAGSDTEEREIIVSVESITLNHSTLTITMGDPAVTLTATILPTNATNRNVVWSSSNAAVAKVDNYGSVTAVSVGAASIVATAADGGKTAISNVTVNPATVAVTGVSLNKTETTVTVGETVTLIATVVPEDATNRNVTWNSGNAEIASVDANGVVTTYSTGTVAIVASTVDGGKIAICNITVTAATVPVTGVSLNTNTLILVAGASETLTATVAPATATNQSVTWASNNHAVATVDNNGRVTAHTEGTATITVTTADGGKTANSIVTVNVPTISVTGVSLNTNTLTLAIGASQTLTATIAPTNATNQSVTWGTNNPAVATVDNNGRVTAHTAGTATITVTTADGSRTASCIVTITPATTPTTDPGVVINGIRWATRNVDMPGTFAQHPHDAGMLFQWNRHQGWASTGFVTGWDVTVPIGTAWYAANDPCPQGWRVPTQQELQSLNNADAGWIMHNGVNGRLFGTAPNQLFLPATALRGTFGTLQVVGYWGCYWSSTANDASSGWHLWFTSDHSLVTTTSRAVGFSVRCVSE